MIIYDGQVADNYMYQDSNQAAIVVSHSTPSLPYPFTMNPIITALKATPLQP